MKFLTRLFGHRTPSPHAQSKHVAKERLKLALTYDRRGLSGTSIDQLRAEISRVIAKHFAVREQDIQISFDRTADYDKLIASIPQALPRSRAQQTAKPARAHKGPPRRRRSRPAN